MNTIHIELKYCELCGGLFFRRQHAPQTFCLPCTHRPHFLLRDCDPATAASTPPSRVDSSTWYGPMSYTIHRLDASAWSAGASPATQSSELPNGAFPATCSVPQLPQSLGDGWNSGGAL